MKTLKRSPLELNLEYGDKIRVKSIQEMLEDNPRAVYRENERFGDYIEFYNEEMEAEFLQFPIECEDIFCDKVFTVSDYNSWGIDVVEDEEIGWALSKYMVELL